MDWRFKINATLTPIIPEVMAAIGQIAAQPCPPAADILSRKNVRNSEKWDWVLSDELFFASYASRALALKEAVIWCQNSL